MMQKQVKIAGIKVKVSLYTTQFDYCPSKLKSLLKKIVFFFKISNFTKMFHSQCLFLFWFNPWIAFLNYCCNFSDLLKRFWYGRGATSTGFTSIWWLPECSPWLDLRGGTLLFDPSRLVKTVFPESFKIKTQVVSIWVLGPFYHKNQNDKWNRIRIQRARFKRVCENSEYKR